MISAVNGRLMAIGLMITVGLIAVSCSASPNQEQTVAWCGSVEQILALPSPDLLTPRSVLEPVLTETVAQVQLLAVDSPEVIVETSAVLADAYAALLAIYEAANWDGLDVSLADYQTVIGADVAAASRNADAFADENCRETPDSTADDQPVLGLWERVFVAGTPVTGSVADGATFRDVLVASFVGEIEMTVEQRNCVSEGITLEMIDQLVQVLIGCDVSFG